MKQRILAVSHCLLNRAAKVRRFDEAESRAEERLRLKTVRLALRRGVQLLQLPCPEFLMYGSLRWGHVYEQFDNPFFRARCREMLEPVCDQLWCYASDPEVRLLGVLGVDGSPSCGVKYTCRGAWGGELCGRDLAPALSSVRLAAGRGVFMEEFCNLLDRRGLTLPFEGLFAPEPERALSMME
ncbi:MAG: CD3072 family TudS-related putative desulfidase [Pyramidobacter sp.]